jgi:hypothetical protein
MRFQKNVETIHEEDREKVTQCFNTNFENKTVFLEIEHRMQQKITFMHGIGHPHDATKKVY